MPTTQWYRRSSRVLPLALALGCGTSDERLRELSERSVARQAEQNLEMARLNQHVAEGSKRLVDADAQMRQDFFQASRAIVEERKLIAIQRHRDPIIAEAIHGLGILAACLAPLAVCIYLLRAIRANNDASEELSELLVLDLTSDQPAILLPARPQRPGPAGNPAALDGPARGDAA